MSCGDDQYSNDCVCSTLLAIADAQDKIEDDYHTGCRRSIEELKGRIKPKGYDTIPVLLSICGTPFSAVGATRHHSSRERQFNIFQSFLFRVHDVSKSSCCATLELLEPVRNFFPFEESSSSSSSSSSYSSDFGSSEKESFSSSHFDFDGEGCSDFHKFLAKLENSKKIVRTGIFVTVDLKDFTSVACLPAVITR